MSYSEAVDDFLSQTRIAVAGVSREGDIPANLIFRKLRDHGYDVVPINPKTETVEGEACYPSLQAVPEPLGALMIATPPGAAMDLIRQAADVGVQNVWMHRAFGTGSVDDDAVQEGRRRGLTVIPGGCPMQFVAPDPFHRCLRWGTRVLGKEPVV